jgi:septal ring factor EnvC (AmiA/AmiB activator)
MPAGRGVQEMTVSDLQWLIGTAIGVVLAVVGIAVAALRAVNARLDNVIEQIKAGDDQLHERVNRVRDDMANGYVRRVDLDSHMKRTDDTLKEMRDDQKAIMRSLATLEAKQQ